MGHLKITHRFGSARWLDFEPYTEQDISWEMRQPSAYDDADEAKRIADTGGSIHSGAVGEHPDEAVLVELGREQPMVCGFNVGRGHGQRDADAKLGWNAPNRPYAEIQTRYDFRGISKKNGLRRRGRLAEAVAEHAEKVGDGAALRAQAVATYNESIARIVERVNRDFSQRVVTSAAEGERKWARKGADAALVTIETEIATVEAELAGLRERIRALRARRHSMFQAAALATLERGNWEVGDDANGALPEPVQAAVREALAKPYTSDGFPSFD